MLVRWQLYTETGLRSQHRLSRKYASSGRESHPGFSTQCMAAIALHSHGQLSYRLYCRVLGKNHCRNDCMGWRHSMMTSSIGIIFRVTGPWCGEFPAQRPMTRSFDVSFDLRLNTRLCKQSRGWWFETPSHPLWRHRNAEHYWLTVIDSLVDWRIGRLLSWPDDQLIDQ